MKKAYSKPQFLFEDFTLSTNIAGDCEVDTHLPSNNTCGVDFSGVTVFLEGMGGCAGGIEVDNVGGDGEFNKICYHVPYGQNLFNS